MYGATTVSQELVQPALPNPWPGRGLLVSHCRYLEIMIRFLSRVPRWLTVALALVAAAVLFVIAQLSGSLHGWHLALKLLLGVLFAVIAVGLPQLDRWQNQQASRLQVRLERHGLPELIIPAYADDEKVIESLIAAEEAACMTSATLQRPARRPGGFNAAAVAEEQEAADTYTPTRGKTNSMTLADYQRLIVRKDAGEELTPDEQRSIADIQKIMSSAFSALSVVNANAFSYPDKRTAEEYREEVQQHLSEYRDFLSQRLQWEYVSRGNGRLELTLINPTDRVFEGVQVEIYLPGRVRALDSPILPKAARTKPVRPRPFGARSPLIGLGLDSTIGGNYVIPKPSGVARSPRPKIDNSASARVTFPLVSLRPRAQVRLDDIALLVEESPGSVISGIWKATATNAEGLVNGTLPITVATTPLAVRELLADSSTVERQGD